VTIQLSRRETKSCQYTCSPPVLPFSSYLALNTTCLPYQLTFEQNQKYKGKWSTALTA